MPYALSRSGGGGEQATLRRLLSEEGKAGLELRRRSPLRHSAAAATSVLTGLGAHGDGRGWLSK